MGIRLAELVERFGGQLVGDPNLELEGIAPLADAAPRTSASSSNSKLRALAGQSQACALILNPNDETAVAATYEARAS